MLPAKVVLKTKAITDCDENNSYMYPQIVKRKWSKLYNNHLDDMNILEGV